jgi:uncharacterized membrane protein
MDFLIYNLSWMLFNIFLALIPVVVAVFLTKKLHTFIRILLFIVWFLFFPNTIYIITDLQYLPYQLLNSSLTFQILLSLQYAVLVIIGIITFLIALLPFENIISKYKIKGREKALLYIGMNFVFAFAVILGKIQRTNSWDVFINLPKVVKDVQATIASSQFLFYILIFGVITNIIYFSIRGIFFKKISFKKKKRTKK